jgi:DNA-binding cell septation regulator SpoVG
MSLTFTAKVTKLQNPSGALRAFATLIVNDVISINGFRVLEGRNGAWATAPQTKGSKPHPETGKDQYWDDVRFLEEKEEGAFKGPIAEAAMAAIMKEYNGADTSATDSRPVPDGDRPTRTKRW